jgi:hypothetical protein
MDGNLCAINWITFNYKKMKNKILLFIISTFLFSCAVEDRKTADESGPNTRKPYTYWWWQGNAVDTANIAYNLEMMYSAGIGGVHIVPIYGVKGEEDKFLKYLSPEWVNMVKYTSKKAANLGMEVDMTLGTGWCFGGSWVDDRNGIMSSRIDKIEKCQSGMTIDLTSTASHSVDTVLCVLAEFADGSRKDITSLMADQKVTLPDNHPQVTLYVLRMFGSMFKVKRAAPGAEGLMLNPFSVSAFEAYIKPYDDAFQGRLGDYISSIYHDSYEYYGAQWSPELFDKFEANRGYKLQEFLPELQDKGTTDLSRRIIADYRLTVSELHRDYIQAVKDWAVKNKVTFRNQTHGSPTNWLDVYAIADIPETESFGSSPFKIPGFDRDSNYISIQNVPNSDVYKFASSAAHVSGKSLVSCETHTWLREHFRGALSHCKPELDKLFVSGINHVYYHGTAYSPEEAAWPGWLFYASTNFAPSNSQHAHFPAQNRYIENCQKLLQSTKPDNEIAVYFPYQDILHTANVDVDILLNITVHNPKVWFYNTEFQNTLSLLKDHGFGYDYISDSQLLESSAMKDGLKTTNHTFKTLIVPKCAYMPFETFQKLAGLIKEGVHVIFLEDLPKHYSGRSTEPNATVFMNEIKGEIRNSNLPNIRILNKDKLSVQLVEWKNRQEKMALHKLDFIRKRDENGSVYFISNLNSGENIISYISIGTNSKDYIFYNPMTGEKGLAEVRNENNENAVLLQLKQGASIFLFAGEAKSKLPRWEYTGQMKKRFSIPGPWVLEFLEGGPLLPEPTRISKLASWTTLPDTLASYFSGVARYSVEFNLEDFAPEDKYKVVFDRVKESVLIRLNGQEVITLFAHPFESDISTYLKIGKNHIEFEVANLPANRIRYLDEQKVNWQKFYDINFVNINYRKFDASKWEPVESGLIGDVSIVCYDKM